MLGRLAAYKRGIKGKKEGSRNVNYPEVKIKQLI